MTKGTADMLTQATAHMDHSQKAAAKKGYEAALLNGDKATNPYAKLAEGKKWAAWECGREYAMRGPTY